MGRYDVVVIGGGFAGVCAARDLGHAGLSVVIVEARDRLGGKTWTAPFPGTAQSVEMGGTWVSPKYHPYVRREIERYGLELSPSRAGDVRFSWSFVGKDSRAFPVDGDELYDLERAWYQIIKESHRIERDTPRDQHDLADLDVSVAEFLDRLALGPQTRQFLEAFAALGSGADPTEWSALTALSWVAAMDHSAWGWYASVVDKLAAGTGGAIQKMVDDSRADVVLSAPVTHVAQDAGRRNRERARRSDVSRGARGRRVPDRHLARHRVGVVAVAREDQRGGQPTRGQDEEDLGAISGSSDGRHRLRARRTTPLDLTRVRPG